MNTLAPSSTSPTPWTMGPCRANPRYWRIYDAAGFSVGRAYRKRDAARMMNAPDLIVALEKLLVADTITTRQEAYDVLDKIRKDSQ